MRAQVAVGRVFAIVGRRLIAGGFELVDADQIGVLRHLARQREHEHQGLLGGGNIRAAADGQHFCTNAVARRLIDVARGEAVLLDESQILPGGGNLFGPERKFLDDGYGRAGKISQQFFLAVDQANLRWIKICGLGADLVAPAAKIGQIVQTEMGEGFDALFARTRVEHDVDQAQEGIVFDDEF
jgi:hypothetical protein